MVRISVAKLARLDGRFGALKKDSLADLLVRHQTNPDTLDTEDPFWMVTPARPDESMLMITDGKAV